MKPVYHTSTSLYHSPNGMIQVTYYSRSPTCSTAMQQVKATHEKNASANMAQFCKDRDAFFKNL